PPPVPGPEEGAGEDDRPRDPRPRRSLPPRRPHRSHALRPPPPTRHAGRAGEEPGGPVRRGVAGDAACLSQPPRRIPRRPGRGAPSGRALTPPTPLSQPPPRRPGERGAGSPTKIATHSFLPFQD